jgi:arginine decarboxylase
MSPSTVEQARTCYNTQHWGGGYFDVANQGHLLVTPSAEPNRAIDLPALIQRMRDEGATLPVLVRFPDILRHRLDRLHGAFDQAIQELNFAGDYTAVYPVKVNQQHTVVRTLVAHGGDRLGLEAGSKSELLAVLGLSRAGGTVVCNGYKDRKYIRLALIGQLIGHRVFIVLEKPSELDLVIEEARRLGVRPLLGLRVQLASIGAGKWQNSGGAKSKFGLGAAAILEAAQRLRSVGLGESLKMIHFHLGSQVANIRDIQNALRESARFYAELCRLGLPVDCVDVGGGLGVDYEGTRSRSFCSINYTLQEYANNVVAAFKDVCDECDLPHPQLISESGRALTAHHAALITNVIDTSSAQFDQPPARPAADAPWVMQHLWHALEQIGEVSPLETYHESQHCLAETHTMFTHGLLDIQQRATAESIHNLICRRLLQLLKPEVRAHRDVIDELNGQLTHKYFCNFSLFQSTPDVWGIDQVFPVVPLQRLHEAPTVRGVIEDITCDSDGRIDHYVNGEGVEQSLPLHPLRQGEEYLLGIFMVGAYQEILGDMHNLFGDTDSADVQLTNNGYEIDNLVRGDTTRQLLDYVKISPEALLTNYREKCATAGLETPLRDTLLAELEAGLDGYTYLEG